MKIRMQERTRLIYHLRVFDAKENRLIGHMVDINENGLLIIGERSVPIGERFRLRMDLPKNLMPEGKVEFAVESKWCKQDKAGEFFSMGFLILDISPESHALVRSLAKQFCTDEEDETGLDYQALPFDSEQGIL